MGLNILFWKKNSELVALQTQENLEETRYCICGNGKPYSDCHELEFALPVGERSDPD